MVATVACFGASVGTSVSSVDAAPAGDDAVVAFLARGVGNGHGRGLSQWGSFGRAIGGQDWTTILAAYYGGTQPGTASEPRLRVRLTGWDGVSVVGLISRDAKAAWKAPSTTTSSAQYSSIYAVEVSDGMFDVFGATSGPGVPAFVVPEVVLAKGATGQTVTQLQQLLAHLGFSPGPIDGQFGDRTEAALEAFQADEGLATDGIWQAPDWTAAAARLAAEDAPPWQKLTAGGPVAGPIRFSTSGFTQYLIEPDRASRRCTRVTVAPARYSSRAAMAAEFFPPTTTTRLR